MSDSSTLASTNFAPSLTKQYTTPATGATITVTSGRNISLIINPAGTIATLTVTMASTPQDQDVVTMSSTQIVTALTLNGGTIIGGIATFAVGGYASFIYNSDISDWIRRG